MSFVRACVAPGRARVRRTRRQRALEAVLLKLAAENGGAFGLSPVKCAQYASRRCQPDKSYCAPVGGYILCWCRHHASVHGRIRAEAELFEKAHVLRNGASARSRGGAVNANMTRHYGLSGQLIH